MDAWFSSDKYSIGGTQSGALALAANDSAIATLGSQVGARASEMCAANAFLHWYSKFDIEKVRVTLYCILLYCTVLIYVTLLHILYCICNR